MCAEYSIKLKGLQGPLDLYLCTGIGRTGLFEEEKASSSQTCTSIPATRLV